MKGRKPEAAGTALNDEYGTERQNDCGSDRGDENPRQQTSHVPTDWFCCPACLMWVPVDGMDCQVCGQDVTEGRVDQ